MQATRHALGNVYAFRRPALHRAALWELPSGALCPVIGTCLSIDQLRTVLDRHFDGSSGASDFELHAGVVRECGARNPVSERIDAELQERHADAVATFAEAVNETDLLRHWQAGVGDGEIDSALWATLTHPVATDALREAVLRDLHMIQHRAAAAVRDALAHAKWLAAENLALRQELDEHRRHPR